MLTWLLCFIAAGVVLVATTGQASALAQIPTTVAVGNTPGGGYTYLVNGQPQLLVGMGYNPMYGHLAYDQRAGAYYRDFKMLCQAGVNTIAGWDADKGYQQDHFDELTLDSANKYGIGLVMPVNLPPAANYRDPQVVNQLVTQATDKVSRFKNHPGVRMWGVGNEVFWEMNHDMFPAFQQAYLQIVDRVHQLDPNHPVIYRGAEDHYVPQFVAMLHDRGDMRSWLLWGMNVYDQDPGPLFDRWPTYGLNRPLVVSEFGAEATSAASRAQGYASMWRSIRAYPDLVLGGAPYVWTTAGPEPTDTIWGLMDANSQPVDETFSTLQQMWRTEPGVSHANCG